jgi:hypothetical protein
MATTAVSPTRAGFLCLLGKTVSAMLLDTAVYLLRDGNIDNNEMPLFYLLLRIVMKDVSHNLFTDDYVQFYIHWCSLYSSLA